MERSESIAELAAALAAFQAEVKDPAKDKRAEIRSKKGEASSFTYPYADLAGILETARPVLGSNGLAVTQEIRVDHDRCVVGAATVIMHSSGQWLEYEPVWIPTGPEAKDYGAAASYSRRYGLMAILGLAPADDGESALCRSGNRAPQKATAGQLRKLEQERLAAGISIDRFLAEIKRAYEKGAPEELTGREASDLLRAILTAKRDRKAEGDQSLKGAGPDLDQEQEDPDCPGSTELPEDEPEHRELFE